ncbi:hypothetical protein GCM10008961_32000 [Deinococcus knuensis]|uniref:Uncharacterized protein n=1 Tax=Deinococcus knuensis TaxID=1837380 RepID=A0ABQ2STY8_9DEIO|nr:hypothetical protein GCM10008961_32000 [Deinococcus knuensis]
MLRAVEAFCLNGFQGASGQDAGVRADDHLLLEFMQAQAFAGREDGQGDLGAHAALPARR